MAKKPAKSPKKGGGLGPHGSALKAKGGLGPHGAALKAKGGLGPHQAALNAMQSGTTDSQKPSKIKGKGAQPDGGLGPHG